MKEEPWLVSERQTRGVLSSQAHLLLSLTRSLVMAWASSKASKVDLTTGLRMLSSQRIAGLFLPNTAEFVAAAGSISSIPRPMRLPEVASGELLDITLDRCKLFFEKRLS